MAGGAVETASKNANARALAVCGVQLSWQSG